MAPGAKRKSALMYVGDWATNDVFVYDYRSGSSVGTLRGFDAPYGMCVDKKGDVYIANFYGGNVVEYTHGGTTPPSKLTRRLASRSVAASTREATLP
jgi:sugar lactone lactonase YvrE